MPNVPHVYRTKKISRKWIGIEHTQLGAEYNTTQRNKEAYVNCVSYRNILMLNRMRKTGSARHWHQDRHAVQNQNQSTPKLMTSIYMNLHKGKKTYVSGRTQIPICTNTMRFSRDTSSAVSSAAVLSAVAAYSKSRTGCLNISW